MGVTVEVTRPITVEVTESRPSGIWVKLPDGRKGLIRPREVSWERRISVPVELPVKGQILEVVALSEESRGDFLFLSLRKCTDPWGEALSNQKYKRGQMIEGEVVNVRNTGVYVQIEPGIDGVILPKDAPFLRGNTIEDVLWLGDKVSAIIDVIDKEGRLLGLNLVKRLRKLPTEKDECRIHLLEYFGIDKHPQNTSPVGIEVSLPAEGKIEKVFIRPSIRRLEHILIVDDEVEWLELLGKGLKREFGVAVDIVESGDDAIANIREGTSYSLIALDMQLKKTSGIVVAEKIHEIDQRIPLLIMSAFEFDEDGKPLEENQYPFCYKSLSNLIQKIDELRSGYWRSSSPKALMKGDASFIRHLEMQSFSKRPPGEIYTGILASLYEQTNVSHCIFLEIDRTRHVGTIISSYPIMAEKEMQVAQDGLYYSPARQVVEEEREFCDNMIDLENDAKYKNFLINLNFQSCLGVPIHIPDQTSRYALFLLDEEALRFSEQDKEGDQRLMRARMASDFLAIAIERSKILNYMRQYEERYSLGQLAAVMIHEMNNKMGALETSVKNLRRHQEDHPVITKVDLIEEWVQGMDKKVQQIAEVQESLTRLVRSYARQVEGDFESVDVNKIVSDVAFEIGRTAERKGTEIFLDLEKDLQPARAIRSQLQQIVLNVTLNAVQMINLQREWTNLLEQQSSRYLPALQHGMLIIQTRQMREDAFCPIEVRIIDNGPGVHWRDRDHIFLAGTTRRGGAGLGLYISRNLIEHIGGKLTLLDSILFLGSAFGISLLPYEN
ncbi:MAG: response regulator [Chloroflexota bacterium]